MDKQKDNSHPNGGKKPITSALKNMKIGGIEAFPIDRVRSVASIIDSLKLTSSLDFSTKRDTDNKLIIVTRNA